MLCTASGAAKRQNKILSSVQTYLFNAPPSLRNIPQSAPKSFWDVQPIQNEIKKKSKALFQDQFVTPFDLRPMPTNINCWKKLTFHEKAMMFQDLVWQKKPSNRYGSILVCSF